MTESRTKRGRTPFFRADNGVRPRSVRLSTHDRRDFFGLAGGALWLAACAERSRAPEPADAFLVIQLTDTHWGYTGPANPDARVTVERAIAEIAAWPVRPDLVVHTGDISHTTPDAAERTSRLVAAKAAFAALGVPVHAIPGEHDAALDGGAAFRDVFGPTHWAIEHRGVHMIGIDNASDPKGGIGAEQLAWFADRVAQVPAGARLVVFAHRPLFSLAQPWDWFTSDGDAALAILERHPGTTVFYGHIHQAHLARTGHTTHASARGLAFPLPAPMSVPEKKPLPWDAASPDHGLGYRGMYPDRGLWIDRPLVGTEST